MQVTLNNKDQMGKPLRSKIEQISIRYANKSTQSTWAVS